MLAARLLRPPTRQLLSQGALSSHTAQSLPLRRAFHATAPRKDGVLEAILYLPHEMMTMIHAHLPWYAAIPLSAFIVRGILVNSAGAWARAVTARHIGLHPLRQAMAHQKRHEVTQRREFSNPGALKLASSREIAKVTRAPDARWKCTLRGQVGWTVAQLPLFFVMAEVIRQMSNAPDGLLGMILTGMGLKTAPTFAHGVSLAPPDPWFEPTLAGEGMLWFPDLLVADPTGVLPFVISGLMFSNVYFSANGPANPGRPSTISKGLRRLLMGVSLLIGPLCQNLPAALMLYWASSTTSVIIWNKWLDWKYPSPEDFVACQRPLQILPPRLKNVRSRRL